jgi:hypothetical protein
MKRRSRRGLLGLATILAVAVLPQTASAAAPVNTNPPTISGTAQQGSTLTADNGTWQNSPSSFQYQWQRCNTSGASCVSISGAAAKTYNVVGNDVGHTLRVRVTAVNADGNATADSAPTAVVTRLRLRRRTRSARRSRARPASAKV